jgi:DNA repair protein RadC
MDPVPTQSLLRTALGAQAARRLEGATLRDIGRLGVAELAATYGLSARAAEKLAALSEIARRAAQEPLTRGKQYRSSAEVFKHYGPMLGHLEVEQFRVVLLDGKHRVISDHLVSQGTLTTSPVHPREVFKVAIRASAAAIVLVHNHPSGDPAPSADDLAITRRLAEVGDLVGIAVLDHVVVGHGKYASLADRGLMR